MIEKVVVSNIEFYNLDFKVGLTNEFLVPSGTSPYYFSIVISPDEKYLAFHVVEQEDNDNNDKIAIWDIQKREIINIFDVCPCFKKIEFMLTKNYIVALCWKNIKIFNIDGELIKRIEFMQRKRDRKSFYKSITNFAPSPNSERLALTGVNELWIYDINNEEIISSIMLDKLGAKTYGRLFWVKDRGLVTTTVKHSRIINPLLHDDSEDFMRRPMKYATMVDPYTWKIHHRVPVRYSTTPAALVETYDFGLYTAFSGGYSGDEYFVSPDGEYVAIVTKNIHLASFSDFDELGKFRGTGKRWHTIRRFKTHVSNVGWSPNSTELIYQYGDSFVILDYVKNHVTRLLITNLKDLKTSRIFWLRDNTIFFLNRKDLGRSLGILKF